MRHHVARVSRILDRSARGAAPRPLVLTRRIRSTLIDFPSLHLPPDVTHALADAFWHHFGPRRDRSALISWVHLRLFGRFVAESAAVTGLSDLHSTLLARYIEWLNQRLRTDGQPWSKTTRSASYTTLRKLLQWLERCRPGLLAPIEYPYNPFPWRNRDTPAIQKLPATQLRAILKACERELAAIRARQSAFAAERAALGTRTACPDASRAALAAAIEQRYDGLMPNALALSRAGHYATRRGLERFGGAKAIAPLLYPDARSLLPYYLAILIHTAGNPEPIAQLATDCLQPIPLLEDRQMLVWTKSRAGQVQRRSFRVNDPNEPPALVREILDYTAPLRRHAPAALRHRLLLFRGAMGRINGLSPPLIKALIRHEFTRRHGLAHFSLASIRPTVLSSFYRASGDLLAVKAVANHRHLATTIRYVDTPQVQAEHRVRVAALQSTFLGHIAHPTAQRPRRKQHLRGEHGDATQAVSMFGFDCKDPFSGLAPGSRRGHLCTHFLGCFTCPNAIIPDDPRTLARLLQAREHLRESAATVHPLRWQTLYAPALAVLENDILPRFSAAELAATEPHRASLPPLPELR